MMGTDGSNFEDNWKCEFTQRRITRTGRTVEKKQLSDSFVFSLKPVEVNDAVEEMAYEEVEFGMELETGEIDESESELPSKRKMKLYYNDIMNHFWFSCKTASRYEQFLSIWSILHHITNKHEWILSHGKGINKCLYETLSENEDRTKPWLDPKKDVKVVKTSAQVLLDLRFLNRVDYYLNFSFSSAYPDVLCQEIFVHPSCVQDSE